MSNTVIKIEGLGKKYLLAHQSPQSAESRYNIYLIQKGG